MAYSSTAEMLAICMACAPTRSPPSHSTATSTMFIRKKHEQSSVANSRFTLMAPFAYSENTWSRRFSSWRSRPNARTTRTPMMLSRSTTFIRSMNPCRRMKIGAVRRITATAMPSITTTTTASKRPICASMRQASTMPAMHRMGTGSTSMIVLTMACCTTLMSPRLRVIIEPVPRRSKSLAENASDDS